MLDRDFRREILSLDRAYDDRDRELYYSQEYCDQNNVVTVGAINKIWCRGDGNKRYEVISTMQIYEGPFPKFKSGL